MKKFTVLSILCLLIIAGCGNSPLTADPTATLTKGVEPTNTISPTSTPIPTETPVPDYGRWDILLPETIEFCKETNIFSTFDPENPQILHNELAELLQKELPTITAERTYPPIMIDLESTGLDIGDNPSASKRPAIIPVAQWDPIFTSCSYLPFEDGTGMYVFGIASQREYYFNMTVLHFGIDETGFHQLLTDGGLKIDRYDFEKEYPTIPGGTIHHAAFAVITGKGYTIPDGLWQRSLDLLNFQDNGTGENLTSALGKYFNTGLDDFIHSINFNKNDEAYIQSINDLHDTLDGFIIPCFGMAFRLT